MASQLIKNGDYWYLKNNKGRNKLLPNEFQNSPILNNAYTLEAGVFLVSPEFSKFSPNINSPLQFIRFLETILHFEVDFNAAHILEPAISYIQNIAFNSIIIKCPIEIIVRLLSENIEHIKDANKLFVFIDVIYHLVNQYMFEKNLFTQYQDNTGYNYDDDYHLLFLCAKHDFKEYFIFVFNYICPQNHDCMPLFSILIINDSKKIFNYLLSNILEDNQIFKADVIFEVATAETTAAEAEEVEATTATEKEASANLELIMQMFYSTKFACHMQILFHIIINNYWSHAYTNEDKISYNIKGQLLIALDEIMIIQLLQLYKYMIIFDKIIYISEYYPLEKDYAIQNLFINVLNMSIQNNYYMLFTYLIKKCADLLFPIMLDSSIKIDIFNIITANNVQFMLHLYYSKLNNCVTGFSHTLFIEQIREDIRNSKLDDTIISIDMLQLFIEIFDDYNISIFSLCGNIETLMYYYTEQNSHLSIALIDKMMKYKCTVDELDIVLNEHIKQSSWGHVIPRYIISYIIIYERGDLYEYIVAKYLQYNELVYIFEEIPITSFVSVNVDYFTSKLQHLLQIKKIYLSHWIFYNLIELCFLNIKFIQTIDMCYDYILEYKPYVYKKTQCKCSILCQYCAAIEDFNTYILHNITKNTTMDSICNNKYDLIGYDYIYRAIIICNTFYNNYKKFNHIYRAVPQLFKFRNITIISKDEIKSMQKFLLLGMDAKYIKSKDFQQLQHQIKNTYLIILLQMCKKINIGIANIILTYINFNEINLLFKKNIQLGGIS